MAKTGDDDLESAIFTQIRLSRQAKNHTIGDNDVVSPQPTLASKLAKRQAGKRLYSFTRASLYEPRVEKAN